MRDEERAADIVRFWRAIEMFSPHDVPKRRRGKPNGDGWVLDLGPDDPAPWQPGFRPRWDQLRPGETRIFTIFGGLYNVKHVQRELKRVFGTDGREEDARPADDMTAMFAFKVDADGRLLEGSATLSACAWAIHRLQRPGPGHQFWLDGFEQDERTFIAALDKLAPPKFAADETGSGTTDSFGAKVGRAVTEHVRNAARDAVDAGAKATGTAVTAAAAGVGAALAGPVVGGIAGAVAGTFVEKLLSPGSAAPADSTPGPQEPPQLPRYDLTPAALHKFVKDLAKALGIEKLEVGGVHVECKVLRTKSAEKPNQQAFLNSIIADDLAQIEGDVRSGKAGGALTAYLSSGRDVPAADRIDVRGDRSALVDGVAPQRIPGGRWPAPPDRSLVMSQQFAVNQILGELGNPAGVFSVNGPPGTGKTTMLRDVLAGLVVERARRLAELDDPRDAFTGVLETVSLGPNYTAHVRGLRPDVTGFEIVLATNSNDAAENVTGEIPGIEAVKGAADDALAAGYFPELATHILRGQAWGLVAAVLGNRENRGEFADRFWWSGEISMQAVLQGKQVENDDWHAAIERFRQAEQKVGELARARQHAADAIQQVRRWKAEIPRREDALADARDECERRAATVARLGGWCHQAHGVYVARHQERENHLARRPGFWRSLFTWFTARRDWARRHAELVEFRDRARGEFDRLRADVTLAQSDLAEAERRWHQRNQELERAKRSASAARRRVDAARDRWPGTVPPDDRADEQEFQLCAPWADEEFCEARTSLFLEALRLHKAFLFRAKTHARGNLRVITELLQRRPPLKPETLLAAWQTLFLVVPMVSTTFASLPRLLAGVGREALGWFFVDEAGQATAQQAAGGLWRCRRGVIVGDPQQLEPIVTLPLPAQNAVRRYHGVDEEWTPDGTSVQRVADRLARYGTSLREPNGEDAVWVGAPLRVHRRCDRLMFDVSNRIAYGGDLMIYGTAGRGDYAGASAWIDVQSTLSHGHWVPEEGRALQSLLTELAAAGVPAREIRIISPFRKVVRESREPAKARFGWTFAQENVGTVHTVQGQEADVVVLVLGTGPDNAGARRWAAEKPNLLNVAVSRAKRRLYVIGNRANWQNLRYFHVLAHALPERDYQS